MTDDDRREVKVAIRYEGNDFRTFVVPRDAEYVPHEHAWTALDRFEDDNQHVSREYRRKPLRVNVDGEVIPVAEVDAWTRLRAEAAEVYPMVEADDRDAVVALRKAYVDGGLAALKRDRLTRA